jgi:hypothetical protein
VDFRDLAEWEECTQRSTTLYLVEWYKDKGEIRELRLGRDMILWDRVMDRHEALEEDRRIRLVDMDRMTLFKAGGV